MAKHYMMLSDLYGRIGQMLREHGDAPIGTLKTPMFPDKPHLPIDWIEPIYPTFSHVRNDINNVIIENYELYVE